MQNEYPLNDNDFEESEVIKVSSDSFARSDGYSFGIPSDSPVKPSVGMTVRFYPAAPFAIKRGLFLNGRKVFYRTKKEDELFRNVEMYGADAKDWLDRWDSGRSVWSISMGGLGPGYEQAIQVTVAELIRLLIAHNFDKETTDETAFKRGWKIIEDAADEVETIKSLGLSGAQFGAAGNLALHIYRRGPIAVMTDDVVTDRHIQVSKNFPNG